MTEVSTKENPTKETTLQNSPLSGFGHVDHEARKQQHLKEAEEELASKEKDPEKETKKEKEEETEAEKTKEEQKPKDDKKGGTPVTAEIDEKKKKEIEEKIRAENPDAEKEEIEKLIKSATEEETVKLREEKLETEVEKAKKEAKEETRAEEERKKEAEAKKEWYEEETAPVSEKQEKEEEVKAEIPKEITEKSQKYDELMNDPAIKAFVEARESGASITSFIDELQGVDPDKMTPRQLYEHDLKQLGNLSEDDLEEALAEFDEMSKANQIRETNSIRERIRQENEERLKRLSEGSKEERKKSEALLKRGQEELVTKAESMEGKKYKNVEITPEMVTDFKDFVNNRFTIHREDGSYDIDKLWDYWFWGEHNKLAVKTNVSIAKDQGKVEILDEVTRPSEENVERKPLVRTNTTEEEDIEEAEAIARRRNPVYAQQD